MAFEKPWPRWQLLWWAWLWWGAAGTASQNEVGPRIPRLSSDPDIVKAAEFAVGELQKLSDTGIYRTLALKRITNASTQDGIFHYNTFMTVELSCPYYLSGDKEESFDMMVMRHREDSALSFAINEFPEMKKEAIEEFWIEKAEQRRQQREETFARWEAEHLAEERMAAETGTADPAVVMASLVSKPAGELLEIIQTLDPLDPRVNAAQQLLNWRWGKTLEGELSKLSMPELQAIIWTADSSPERRETARQLLIQRVRSLDGGVPVEDPPSAGIRLGATTSLNRAGDEL